MKVKKLKKILTTNYDYNVYQYGEYIDRVNAERLIKKYGEEKVETLSCGIVRNYDQITYLPIMRIYLKG